MQPKIVCISCASLIFLDKNVKMISVEGYKNFNFMSCSFSICVVRLACGVDQLYPVGWLDSYHEITM